MTSRILPSEEWPRLAGTELESVWPVVDPKRVQILVVEDGDQIIACWGVFPTVHLEGVWVHPDHRKRSGVARRLLRSMRKLLTGSVDPVITGSVSPEVDQLIAHLGGIALPGTQYVLPKGPLCQQ